MLPTSACLDPAAMEGAAHKRSPEAHSSLGAKHLVDVDGGMTTNPEGPTTRRVSTNPVSGFGGAAAI